MSSAHITSAGTAHGYPDGLAGQDIPLPARVFAVADVLDALTTVRPYRPASPLGVARNMIVAESGQHFDPAVIEEFKSDRRRRHSSGSGARLGDPARASAG